jgi:putative spermidine/putrescine transport system permease protein
VRPGRGWRKSLGAWLGVLPFFVYVTAFLLVPSTAVLVGAFLGPEGRWTLRYAAEVLQGQYLRAFVNSFAVSAVTALAGGVFGFLVAYAGVTGGPRWVRPALTTFSGVAANFAGVPLAFAFIATLGTTGLVTQLVRTVLGVDLYARGFTLFSFAGLSLTYVYFQLPLMILVITPALDGMRREWWEAAANLGATPWHYWRYVGLPILLPSLLGAVVLLFGNAFAAYATPYALTSGVVNLVTMQIANVLQGNVLSDPQLGHALSTGMVLVVSVSMTLYLLLQKRVSRWTR